MKKLMLLAAMLAMVLVAAAPAFGQDDFEGGDVDQQGGNVTAGSNSIVQVCQNFFNVQNQVAADVEQTQTVSQSGAIIQVGVSGEGDVEQQAELNQAAEQVAEVGNVDISDVNQVCAQAVATGGTATATARAATATATAQAQGGGSSGGGGGAMSSSSGGGSQAKAQLPATGGASLFALGAGALLVTGGLVARRIIK